MTEASDPRPSPLRRAVGMFLRVAVSLAALVFVIYWLIDVRDRTFARLPSDELVEIRTPEERRAWEAKPGVTIERRDGLVTILLRVNKLWLAPLTVALIVPTLALAWRWWTLLRANSFDVPFGRAFILLYIGQFFSQFLPGAVGGDVVRMVLTARASERKAAAAATVALDRVIGLLTMVLVATVAVAAVFHEPKLRVPAYTVLGIFGGLVLGTAVYFSPVGRGLRGILPFQKQVAEIDAVAHSLRHGPRTFAATIGQSMIAQFSAMIIAYGIAHALHIRVAFVPFLLFEVLIFILTAVPVSAGGWGVQEIAYAKLFLLVGVPANEAVALSVLFKLASLAVSLPGGVLFALGMHRAKDERREAKVESGKGDE